MNDEFYIGYRKVAPPRTARFVLCVAVLLGVVLIGAAAIIGYAQQIAGDGEYAFGTIDTFEGLVRGEPLLHIELLPNDGAGPRKALVVDQGKHGAPDVIRHAVRKRIRIEATRITRDGILMLELHDAQHLEIIDDVAAMHSKASREEDNVTLIGELVDTKCYLGVMNPGRGKVHRGCAAECLRGGVPPGLLVSDSHGEQVLVLLEPHDGHSLDISAEWAGRKLMVEGYLRRSNDMLVMKYTQVRPSK